MATRTDFRARTLALTVSWNPNPLLFPGHAAVCLFVTVHLLTITAAELDLPEYESYESLRKQILKAITAGSDYFGFA